MTDLDAYRARKAAARAYRPSVRPIWTPADAVDTAQEFAAELDRAERGVPERQWWLSPGRERKAKVMDFFAVVLLMLLMAALGVLVMLSSSPAAKADDIDNMVFAYAETFGSAVCATLDEGHDSFAGVTGIAQAIVEDGLTHHQAGQVIYLAVDEGCPEYMPLLMSYARANSGAVA